MLNKTVFTYCLAFILGFSGNALSQSEIKPLLVDVRTPGEFSQEHLVDAINIEYQNIVVEIDRYVSDKNSPIELYCRSGNRSGVATQTLQQAGYRNVTNLGGLEALKKAGYPAE